MPVSDPGAFAELAEEARRAAELTLHLFFAFNEVNLQPEGAWREALESRRTGEREAKAEIERLDAARVRLRRLRAAASR